MIIIGAYPDGFELKGNPLKLPALCQILDDILPKKICLHILPFYPNSGDYGFAPDDWFTVRSDLGEWEDLKKISSNWKIIVDGIYNHVGVNHKWVKGFHVNPENYNDILHAYKVKSFTDGPNSPRGQPVLTKTNSDYYLWKTFSNAAVDIRLDSQVVQSEIDDHLTALSSNGIWGVRLDALAYYAKEPGSQIRHNKGVYELANFMADKVRSHNLHALAQLDCDKNALTYYSDIQRSNIPINDFTYSTYLALSILEENPKKLVKHVVRTQNSGRILLRVPRTHDGILLRSMLLEKQDKNKIIGFAESNNISVRAPGGDPYELNCSAPYLYSLLAKDLELFDTIIFTIAVTGMMPGWSYFYLPYLLGYIPEHIFNPEEFEDPRALNRQPISKSTLDAFVSSLVSSQIVSLLKSLHTIHASQGYDFKSNILTDGKLLVAITEDNKFRLVANFSKNSSQEIPRKWLYGDVVESRGQGANKLGRLGYSIMSLA
jgi:sucrose phosphorylase